MFCPRCRTEYREGFDTCADCQVPLVNELPPEPVSEIADPDNLVSVLSTDDPMLIEAAKTWLQNADIPFFVRGEEGQGIIPGIGSLGRLNGLRGMVQIQVDKSEEENAKDLLSDLVGEQSPDDTVDKQEEEPEAPVPQKAEEKRDHNSLNLFLADEAHVPQGGNLATQGKGEPQFDRGFTRGGQASKARRSEHVIILQTY